MGVETSANISPSVAVIREDGTARLRFGGLIGLRSGMVPLLSSLKWKIEVRGVLSNEDGIYSTPSTACFVWMIEAKHVVATKLFRENVLYRLVLSKKSN